MFDRALTNLTKEGVPLETLSITTNFVFTAKMPFTLFTNLLARVPFSKPSGSTANKIKDSFAKPSAHSPRNSGTVDILLSDSHLQRRPRIKRNVEPHAQWRHAEYIYPSVVLAGSPSPPIATAHVAPPQDSEEAMEGLNGLMLRKFKKQLPADGQIRVVPAHGSLVAIVRCGGPKGWNVCCLSILFSTLSLTDS